MGAKTHHLSAGPVYEEILRQVAHSKLHGSPRQRYTIDTWEPAVQAHSPGGPLVGDGCSQCGQPWPCRFLLNLLNSGLVSERGNPTEGAYQEGTTKPETDATQRARPAFLLTWTTTSFERRATLGREARATPPSRADGASNPKLENPAGPR